jgi:hypothetical protein
MSGRGDKAHHLLPFDLREFSSDLLRFSRFPILTSYSGLLSKLLNPYWLRIFY